MTEEFQSVPPGASERNWGKRVRCMKVSKVKLEDGRGGEQNERQCSKFFVKA